MYGEDFSESFLLDMESACHTKENVEAVAVSRSSHQILTNPVDAASGIARNYLPQNSSVLGDFARNKVGAEDTKSQVSRTFNIIFINQESCAPDQHFQRDF